MNCKEIFVDDSGFRIYYNGVIERLMRLGYWKVVPNTPNNSKLYNQIGYGTKHKKLLRSRLIWAAYHPEFNLFDKTCIIDHIDNTKLHNYIENLRCISSKENSQNRPDALGCRGACRRPDHQWGHGAFWRLPAQLHRRCGDLDSGWR